MGRKSSLEVFRKILNYINKRPFFNLKDLVYDLEIDRTCASKYLKIFIEANWITDFHEGNEHCYIMVYKSPQQFRDFIMKKEQELIEK